jgi:hypothetical protein
MQQQRTLPGTAAGRHDQGLSAEHVLQLVESIQNNMQQEERKYSTCMGRGYCPSGWAIHGCAEAGSGMTGARVILKEERHRSRRLGLQPGPRLAAWAGDLMALHELGALLTGGSGNRLP